MTKQSSKNSLVPIIKANSKMKPQKQSIIKKTDDKTKQNKTKKHPFYYEIKLQNKIAYKKNIVSVMKVASS